ncbi:MAG TPA: GlsB/YeaQ/YmgE family stress response membrane protein [Bacteroidetes bacterium]|jgi:uncharacterized membrane protein YeaQ/YmgE (transglycosylase-associated protein family)|nr:MAG: transglycosylase [Sphingobacteriales bacterium BACL12 MAG-120802-bin5]KRP07787.1 MAG: transglycosylase [Sphingobacteriales bacterium BACL12 MAG-120813-bin55]HCK20871.1 GlsB/YeaQ/YmgE family stress response membrane protein [Bacteroidota bacterium]
MNLIYFILIGAAAGWIGGKLIRGESFGGLGNIIVGIVGAVLGGWIFDELNINASGIAGALASAVVGAVVFLLLIGLLKRK